jgi:hypothetical protein
MDSRLTALTSVSKLYATKRIRLDRKTGKLVTTHYGREKHFRIQSVELSGFEHLCRCLDRLTKLPYSFVVRGEPLPGTDLENARRLLHPDPDTGEVETFREASRRWLAVDMDKIRRPVTIDPVSDPEGAIEYLIGLLPPELHDASCWWQFTSSQSLPGPDETLCARLWFWLAEPLDDAALTRWALSANKTGKIIDPSLYRVVQAHYVADPIFEGGIADPLPRRHGVRVGIDEAVTLLIPEPNADDPYVGSGQGYVGIGIEGHLDEIGGERGFRVPMVSAIAAYFAANSADADPEPIKRRVREAIANAPRGGRSDADIERYLSDRHLNDIVGWVRARERASPRPQKPSFNEILATLGSAVPVGNERQNAVRVLASHLLRRLYEPRLAASLVTSWNVIHCAPPLPGKQVDEIVAAMAAHQLKKLGANHAAR